MATIVAEDLRPDPRPPTSGWSSPPRRSAPCSNGTTSSSTARSPPRASSARPSSRRATRRCRPCSPGRLRGRLRLPAARRGAVRLSRRQAGAQIHLPRHDHADGHRDRRGRADPAGVADRLWRAGHHHPAARRCRGWRSAANMAARRSMSRNIRRRGSAGFYTSFIQAERRGRVHPQPGGRAAGQGWSSATRRGRRGAGACRSSSRWCCSRCRCGCG